jgi:electron transport complex protein RnfG
MEQNKIIKNALILCVITVIAGGLLGLVYEVTKEPIATQRELAKSNALKQVSGDADSYEPVEFEVETVKGVTINEINRAYKNNEISGYDFILSTREGYNGNIDLAVGINVEGNISGVVIIKDSETVGLGSKINDDEFKGQFIDKPATKFNLKKSGASGDDEINAIGGATISSAAITNAINRVVEFYEENLAKEVQ